MLSHGSVKKYKHLIEISTICEIPMSSEISSNTPRNKQSQPVLHTTSAEKTISQ